MNDNGPKGQQAIDKETERRNRENETGQPEGQKGQFGEPGGDTALASRADDKDKPRSTGLGSSPRSGGEETAAVGTAKEDSSAYLTKEEEGERAFAPEGQGAPDTSAGRSDIKQPAAGPPDAVLDEGSSAKP